MMRLWGIKIIFLMGAFVFFLSVSYSKEYDFSFDVRNTKEVQKPNLSISDSDHSTASWRLGMQAALLPGFLKGSGELVYGGFTNNSNAEFSGWDKYLMKLGVSGKQDAFGYGLDFYSVGQKYEGVFNSEYRDKKGYTGFKSWLSWNFDKLQVKTKYSEYWTKTPSLDNPVSTFDQWYEIETSYPLTSAPFTELSIAYGLGERSRTNVLDYIKTYEGPLNSLKAKFRFVDDYLTLSSGLNQSSSQNDLDDRKGFQQEMVYIDSTLFPGNLLSVISSFRYSVDTHSSTSYTRKINKRESSIGLLYKPMEIPGKLKITSAFNNYRSDDGEADQDEVSFGAQYDWKVQERNPGLKTSWTVDLRYKDVKDYINPASSTSNWSLNLLWRLPLS